MKWPLLGAAMGFGLGLAVAFALVRLTGANDGWAGIIGYVCGFGGIQGGFVAGVLWSDR